MSEPGWQSSVGAKGVDDWVVLHGGATGAYRHVDLARTVSALAREHGAVADRRRRLPPQESRDVTRQGG